MQNCLITVLFSLLTHSRIQFVLVSHCVIKEKNIKNTSQDKLGKYYTRQSQQTSLHAPVNGAATWRFNGVISLPVYCECFMTIVSPECCNGNKYRDIVTKKLTHEIENRYVPARIS